MRDFIEYKYNLKKIEIAKNVIWYGWDYSYVTINDYDHFKPKEMKAKIIPRLN